MALTDEMKADLSGWFKEAGGMSKSDITDMLNGLDKKQSKEMKKLAEAVEGLGGFAKVFDGMKPKKLAKALNKLAKGKKAGKGDDGTPTGGKGKGAEGSNDGDGNLVDVMTPKKLKKLSKQVKELQAERDAANAKTAAAERNGTIKDLLSSFQWAKDTGRELVFADYSARVSPGKDGKLVIKLPDGDYAEFNKEFVEQDVTDRFDFALKKPESGGSGISRSEGHGNKGPSLDDDLSTPEKQAAYAKEISKKLYGNAA